MKLKPNKGLFIRFNIITIIAVYFLILVGGIVRSTGSGMGCPDWPKCFGSYLPPTAEHQLPENYNEIFANQRIQKNERLANVLQAIGFDQLAEEILNENNIRKEYSFNLAKTWTEYINRLVGVGIGCLIIVCAYLSYSYIGISKRVFILSLVALVLVVFQGWIGSLVVSTNLLPGMISFHMMLAIALIVLLIYLRFAVTKDKIGGLVAYKPYKVKRLLTVCMVLFFAQILLGTQVRAAIDTIALSLDGDDRFSWVGRLGIIFYVHRLFSFVLLLIHGYLIFRLSKSIKDFKSSKLVVWSLLGLIILEVVTGFTLASFGLPYLIQPIHLLLALIIFGIQYFLYLIIKEKTDIKHTLIKEG